MPRPGQGNVCEEGEEGRGRKRRGSEIGDLEKVAAGLCNMNLGDRGTSDVTCKSPKGSGGPVHVHGLDGLP